MSRPAPKEMSFWEHASELITRVRKIVFALIISSIAAMVIPINLDSLRLSFTDPMYETMPTYLINQLRQDLLPSGVQLLPVDWFAPFMMYIYASVFIGVVVSSPVITYEIYKFIDPALKRNERKYIYLFTSSFTLLFLTGVAFGYFLIAPVTFNVLLFSGRFLGLAPMYEFTGFYSIALSIIAVCGLAFTFPVFFLLLVKIGILQTSYVTKIRKYFYAGLFIAIAVLTADPSPISDAILFVPLVILMEMSILIGKRIEKGRKSNSAKPIIRAPG